MRVNASVEEGPSFRLALTVEPPRRGNANLPLSAGLGTEDTDLRRCLSPPTRVVRRRHHGWNPTSPGGNLGEEKLPVHGDVVVDVDGGRSLAVEGNCHQPPPRQPVEYCVDLVQLPPPQRMLPGSRIRARPQ